MRFNPTVKILLLICFAFRSIPAAAQELPVSDSNGQEQKLSQPSDVEKQLRQYDRQIFLDLVKLAEFNARFQQEVNHYAGWRKYLYPIAQEAGYACFLGFNLTDLSQRGRGWNNPGRISPRSSKRSLSAATVGGALGATSSIFELALNGVESIKADRKGFSTQKSVAFVQNTVKQVDEMLERRHALMLESNITSSRAELLELKEQLLKYERDRLVFEFKRWSAHSRAYNCYKNTFYIINATVNMSRFSAVQLGFKSFTQPRCTGATGPILLSAACLASVGPAASTLAGNWMQRHQEKSLAKKLPARTFLSDEEAKQKFDRLTQLLEIDETNQKHVQLASELIRLREEKLGLDRLIFHEEKTIVRFRRVAGQQVITAPLISSLGASSATIGTVGYFAYRQKPVVSNKLGIAGDTAVIAAEAVALVATPTAAIMGLKYENNLRKKGEHPDQLLEKRIKDLKTLEDLVSNAWR
ncbi:MAG: hypothetical protein K2X27_21100 [Candidatus Obscuribacterales bacterium]|nr:hypothetical protein [Candidatus Obscuribacterales bacterium]